MALTNLENKHGSWRIRSRENGRRLSHNLGSVAEYPTEASIAPRYYEFMAERSKKRAIGGKGDCALREFVLGQFFPYIDKRKKPSTVKGYKQNWNRYLDERLGGIRLNEFRRAEAQLALEALVDRGLSKNLVANCRITLGSIFSRALTLGLIEYSPVTKMKIEGGGDPKKKYYTLDEIECLIVGLTGRNKVIVALFAYAALRPGEVAGFQWENYDGDMIRLTHNVWEGKIVTLKTKWAVAPIPVVAPLKSVLDEYRRATAGVSWVFPGDTGKPVRLNALAERTIKGAFKRLGVQWKTWYGFRRGAATYLSEIGLSPDKVSAILRHFPSSKTAETHYIMTREKKNKAIGEVVDQLLAKRASEQDAILREQLQKKPTLIVN